MSIDGSIVVIHLRQSMATRWSSLVKSTGTELTFRIVVWSGVAAAHSLLASSMLFSLGYVTVDVKGFGELDVEFAPAL